MHKGGQIDALVFSESKFKSMLDDHRFLAVVCSQCLPPEAVWHESISFKRGFKFQKATLLTAVNTEFERDMQFAAKLANKGNIDQAKKVLVQTSRMLLITEQLCSNDTPSPLSSINFGVGEKLKSQLKPLSWADCESQVLSKAKSLFGTLPTK